ncbi:hypothetical protein [Runella sp. SP2]|uniref:hypothetical protein n=1 Tax=Runella sp. SP2 TaxID=2268026 RepID=UPI000F08F9EC|nr:hypothetical protein [Runella sp. SP2]AYQ35399.1 hypothetical protein DTQ70_25975 [Runella sp. SP2]
MRLFYFLLGYLSLIASAYAQQNLIGLYEGTFMEQPCVLSLNVSKEKVTGTFYTSYYSNHGLEGTLINGELKALLHHKTLGTSPLTGALKSDKLDATIVFLNNTPPFQETTVSLRLERKNNDTTFHLEAYFEKPRLDTDLVGPWKVISETDYKNELPLSHTKKHFFKEGEMRIEGMDLGSEKDSFPLELKWYIVNEYLYSAIFISGAFVLESKEGRYNINNDILTVLGERKTMYLREP